MAKFLEYLSNMQHMNKMDEAMGLIFVSISNSLQFNLEGCDNPRDMWVKFKDLFHTINEFRELQI